MSRAGFQREYNVAVLGSGGVGKSAITAQFVQGVFIERYDPTIEDTYRKYLDVDGRQVMLEIMDTAGTEQFTSIRYIAPPTNPPLAWLTAANREMYMRHAQGFLLVFSITSLSSLQELVELHEQIVRMKNDPDFPIVLVGNKSDLEEDRAVSRTRAFSMSQGWGNIPYYETSARRRQNVNEIFVDVCRQIIRKDAVVRRGDEGHRDDRRRRRKQRQREEREARGSRCTIL